MALALAAVLCTVNALSILHDAARDGDKIPSWRPWATEYTSLVGFAAALPVAVCLDAIGRRAGRLPLRIAGLLIGSVLFSLVHIGVMVGAREALWGWLGRDYSFDWRQDWLYEYRKDLGGYAIALAMLAFARWMPSRPTAEPADPRGATGFVRLSDGRREAMVDTARLRAVCGGGNYVELVFADGRRKLLRTTLAATADRLAAHGFRRTHKSWLVRLDSVEAIERTEAGDYRLRLKGGIEAPLSRRRRPALAEIRADLGERLEPTLL